MTLAKAQVYLLDVNAVIALLDESHFHHLPMSRWFGQSGLQWALCPFTEAGVLRFFTRPAPRMGGISIKDVSSMLSQFKQHPGYHYQPVSVTGTR